MLRDFNCILDRFENWEKSWNLDSEGWNDSSSRDGKLSLRFALRNDG